MANNQFLFTPQAVNNTTMLDMARWAAELPFMYRRPQQQCDDHRFACSADTDERSKQHRATLSNANIELGPMEQQR